jgi:hypothetical protein
MTFNEKSKGRASQPTIDDDDAVGPVPKHTKTSGTAPKRTKALGAPDPHKARKGPQNKLDPEIASILGRAQFVAKIPIDKLNLDPSYQYLPTQEFHRLNQLKNWLEEAGGFSTFLAGAIHVHEREDGTLWTLDGGGRSWMAADKGVAHVAGFVSKGLTREQEAKAFIYLNKNVRIIRAPHIFLSAAGSGVEPNATIARFVEQAGYAIERTAINKKSAIIGTGALMFVHQLGEEILELSLMDLRHTWGDTGGLVINAEGKAVVEEGKHVNIKAKLIDGRALIAQAVCRAAGGSKFKQKRFREALLPAAKNFHSMAALARQNAATYVTTRTPQSRDSAPEIAKLVISTFNSHLERSGEKRISWDDAKALKSRFEDDDQYQDVWNWNDK